MADYRGTEETKRRLGEAVALLSQAQDLVLRARRLAEEVESETDNEIAYDIQQTSGDFSAAEEVVSDLRRALEGTWLSVEVADEEEGEEDEE